MAVASPRAQKVNASAPAATRVYPAIGHEAPVPSPLASRRRPRLAGVLLAVAALVVVAVFRSTLVRALLPLALALAAVLVLVRGRRRAQAPPSRKEPLSRSLDLDGRRLLFRPRAGAPAVSILELREPFGLTLFSTHGRDRVVALLSSRNSVFYVGAGMGSADALGSLLDRASTVALDEAALDAIAPDGESLLLAPHHLARLVRDLLGVAPESFDRLVTSDARGASVMVDVNELRVGADTFDLTVPLEWKAIVFQEPLGAGVAVFQGTWVRQAGSEVVLVSSLTLGAPLIDPAADGLSRAIERDLRLMQAQVEDPPPPREKRYAIDRMMMIPLRSALLRAPRRSVEPLHVEA